MHTRAHPYTQSVVCANILNLACLRYVDCRIVTLIRTAWRHTLKTYTTASQGWPSYLAVAGLWRRCHSNWREGRGHDPERTHSRMLLVSGLLSLPLICFHRKTWFHFELSLSLSLSAVILLHAFRALIRLLEPIQLLPGWTSVANNVN